MDSNRRVPLCLAVTAVVAFVFLANPKYPTSEAKDTNGKAKVKKVKASNTKGREADIQAIRKSSQDFAKAFEKADAKLIAGFWTENGEYIDGDGETIKGRAAIEKSYQEFFAKNPKLKVEVKIDTIRFVSKDTAIEEGLFKATKGKSEQPTVARYSVLHVRENGQWLMAVVREWPDEGTSLKDVEWLIGTWTAKTKEAEVQTTYKWTQSKKFIRVRFEIKRKDRTVTGTQIIGMDPRTQELRSWLFESQGGIGEATWSQDGKRWLQEASGVGADGSEMTATNILVPAGKNAFTLQTIDRTVDGEEMPNIAPIKFTRVK